MKPTKKLLKKLHAAAERASKRVSKMTSEERLVLLEDARKLMKVKK